MAKVELTKTYRSTKEIVEFTRELIEGGDKIIPFNRSGRKPTVIKTTSTNHNEQIQKRIYALQGSGHNTIAVICRTAEESKIVFDYLKEETVVHLIEKSTISYEKGVLIIPSYLAKGIEFDAVIIYNSSGYQIESERKLFYTVCTRAMHELYLYMTNDLSPLMKNVSKELYQLE